MVSHLPWNVHLVCCTHNRSCHHHHDYRHRRRRHHHHHHQRCCSAEVVGVVVIAFSRMVLVVFIFFFSLFHVRGRRIEFSIWLDEGKDDIKEKRLSVDKSVRPCYMEAYVTVHRPHIKVGKHEVEENRVFNLHILRYCRFNSLYFLTYVYHTYPCSYFFIPVLLTPPYSHHPSQHSRFCSF